MSTLCSTSDLRRAVETAEIAFADSEIPRFQDVRLRECNYGELSGHPVQEIEATRLARIEVPFPNGESYRQVVERTQEFLNELARDWDGKRVVLIAHSANRWALAHLLHGIPLEDAIAAPFVWQEGWEFTLDSPL